MNVDAFLAELRSDPNYAGQIVHVHEEPARAAAHGGLPHSLSPSACKLLTDIGIERLYTHQAEALHHALKGEDVLVATGTASGKSLCYQVPILEHVSQHPQARALLLFPTKALCQDQFKSFRMMLDSAGLADRLSGVFDGDTPASLRRRLRDHASVIFSNPDMVHASLMSQHGRWADFLANLRILVIDELHVYNGMFGSNMASVLTRLFRLCRHYGSSPRLIACSATIANPCELGHALSGRNFHLVETDGSPRGRRVYVFWNPPRVRDATWHSRRSANVEAHDLMARLVGRGIPTITFSKAKMTAEMIHRYVCDKLRQEAPGMASKVTPYRGGYLPEERREIESRLFSGELMGVSTTSALELGIDVGSLDASIVVGYPGTLASFFQQAGRAGRRDSDSVVFLVGLDTSVNQYIMSNPDYIFGRCIEQAVVDPANPFVVMGHLRCATHELPLPEAETSMFGEYAQTALDVLRENRKVTQIDNTWYHASPEVPQHEVTLRNAATFNVVIQDAETGEALGQVNEFDAEPILHPEAIYMHRGETYRVLDLDLGRGLARVKREEVDYYTDPVGGTDIHHIDQPLREKPFGTGRVDWGEVTAYFSTAAYRKIHFYTLDILSQHPVNLPTLVLETMAVWLVPPEELLDDVRRAGLDVHSGLRGIGYGTRMLLPLFLTCDTRDFSHTVGSANSPWQAVFIYERYPHGLGFTEKAYDMLHLILPAVLENVRHCSCKEGCPCCVGKPLRGYATWNVELGEASIPSKAAALMILEGLLGDGSNLQQPDNEAVTDSDEANDLRLRQALERRLERMRDPQVFHPITPQAELGTGYPGPEPEEGLGTPDVAERVTRRRAFDRDLHKRINKKLDPGGLPPHAGRTPIPAGMKKRLTNLPPDAFPGRPALHRTPAAGATARNRAPCHEGSSPPEREGGGARRSGEAQPISLGDRLAARARKRYKDRLKDS